MEEMMRRFTEWKDARTEAERLANQCKLDVAIRKVKEFGKVGFNVSFAGRNDSDYALAEIVKPQTERKPLSDPRSREFRESANHTLKILGF